MYHTFKKYYLHWYDSKLELGKQIHLLKSAVFDLITTDTPFLMSPNTLFFLQDVNENAHYWEKLVDFIPGVNRITGVASMLREHDEELKVGLIILEILEQNYLITFLLKHKSITLILI